MSSNHTATDPKGYVSLRVLSQLPAPENALSYRCLAPGITVQTFKTMISSDLSSKPSSNSMRLIHAGHVLANDSATLYEVLGADAFAQQGTHTLHLVLRQNTTSTSSSQQNEVNYAGPTPAHPQPQAQTTQPPQHAAPQMANYPGIPAPFPQAMPPFVPGMPPFAMNTPPQPFPIPQPNFAQHGAPYQAYNAGETSQTQSTGGGGSGDTSAPRQQMTGPPIPRNMSPNPAMLPFGANPAQMMSQHAASIARMQQARLSAVHRANTPHINAHPSNSVPQSNNPTPNPPRSHVPRPPPNTANVPFPFQGTPGANVRETIGPNGERISAVAHAGAFHPQQLPPQPQQHAHQQRSGIATPSESAARQSSQPTVAYLLNSPSGPHALVYTADGVFTSRPSPQRPHNAVPAARPASAPPSNPPQAAPNATPAPQHQPQPQVPQQGQQQAQPAPPQNAEEANADVLAILGVLFRHIWLLIRIFGLIWLLTRGASNRRTLLIVLAAGVWLLLQAGIFGDRPLERLRARVERGPQAAQRPEGQGEPHRDNGRQGEAQSQDATGRRDQTAAAGNGRPQPRESGWLWERVSGWERAVTLFLASLYPGVGEQQVRARAQAEREAREGVQQPQQEARPAAVEGAVGGQQANVEVQPPDNHGHGEVRQDETAGRRLGDAEGRASGIEAQPQGDTRERRAGGDAPQAA